MDHQQRVKTLTKRLRKEGKVVSAHRGTVFSTVDVFPYNAVDIAKKAFGPSSSVSASDQYDYARLLLDCTYVTVSGHFIDIS